MTALSQGTPIQISNGSHHAYLKVAAGATIYQGGLVEETAAGVASALSGTGNFAGVALETVTGGTADGDVMVHVVRKGTLRDVVLASGGSPGLGTQCYSATDNPADITSVSTSATSIGKFDAGASSTWDVEFEALGLRSV